MFDRLNAYRIMWILVHFDLPTETKKDRKNYAQFRKKIMADGFIMFQFSMYIQPGKHRSTYKKGEIHFTTTGAYWYFNDYRQTIWHDGNFPWKRSF